MLLDPDIRRTGGVPDSAVQRRATAPFEAGKISRRTAGYQPSNSGINTLIEMGGDGLRAWSRDLIRKDPWASNMADTWTAEAIGTGIVPEPQHPDDKRRKELSRWWKRFMDEIDADGTVDGYAQQALIWRSNFEGGETIIRRRWRRLGEGNLLVPIQTQVMEAEHLPLSKNEDLPSGNIVRNGIEFNGIGQRVAYHLYRERPDERQMWFDGYQFSRVHGENVIHTFRVIRPGQHRGCPWLTPVMIKLWELNQYDDAELVRKKLVAFITWIFTKSDPNIVAGFVPQGEGGEKAEDGTPIGVIEPGSTVETPPGVTATPASVADVGGQYLDFMRTQLSTLAVGVGLTYEQVSGDLSKVNFSSIRTGVLKFRRLCEQLQYGMMVHQVLRVYWRWFIEGLVIAGKISAEDYAANRDEYLDVNWRTPKWPWVNPKDDIDAEIAAIDNLIKPRSQTQSEQGENPEEVDEQIRRDQEREERLKLKRREKGKPAEDASAKKETA